MILTAQRPFTPQELSILVRMKDEIKTDLVITDKIIRIYGIEPADDLNKKTLQFLALYQDDPLTFVKVYKELTSFKNYIYLTIQGAGAIGKWVFKKWRQKRGALAKDAEAWLKKREKEKVAEARTMKIKEIKEEKIQKAKAITEEEKEEKKKENPTLFWYWWQLNHYINYNNITN